MENTVLLGHGSGGIMMKDIIEDVFFDAYASPELKSGDDAAVLNNVISNPTQKIAFSTDSFVVNPIFFPGGDIGRLAVCGTVNDVATSGAIPKVISASFILEEGFLIDDLKQICRSFKLAADEARVKVVTGDTKVVGKGGVDKIFINTSGIGVIENNISLSGQNCQPGDMVIVSGTLGDHGITVMAKREGLTFSTNLKSDAAPLNQMVADVIKAAPNTRCFRDPTRGGLASTLNEFSQQSNCDITVFQKDIPIKDSVISACEMLGYDPLQVANEGKLVCVVSKNEAQAALEAMRSSKYGKDAAIIGKVSKPKKNSSPKVFVKTPYNTERILDMLVGEQLPRIC